MASTGRMGKFVQYFLIVAFCAGAVFYTVVNFEVNKEKYAEIWSTPDGFSFNVKDLALARAHKLKVLIVGNDPKPDVKAAVFAPDSADQAFADALQAFRTNKKDRNALQRADKLVAGTENALFNLNLLGRHYIAALDIDNAVRVYELAYQMVPDDLATQRNYAQALATAGNMKEAEIVVGRILQKYPDDFIARQMQAVFDKRAQAKAEKQAEKGG